MRRSQRGRDEALKPIGVAVSAVMAGLSAHAVTAPAPALAPAPRALPHAVDPTNDPRRDEDPRLVLGPSTPVEPFADEPEQADLFRA